MKRILTKLFGKSLQKSDFSAFFNDASSREKKRLFQEVIRKANEDQRRVFEQSRLKAKTG